MSEHETCESCGQTYPPGELIWFDSSQLCSDCLNEATLICTECGDRIWRDANAGDDERPLCQDCYDEHYYTCHYCGRVIHEDDAYTVRDALLCYDCYRQNHRINDYYYKPHPHFFGEGKRFFGVELEMDEGGEDSENAGELLDIAKRDEQNRLSIKSQQVRIGVDCKAVCPKGIKSQARQKAEQKSSMNSRSQAERRSDLAER